jgi:hypothetical protein
MPVRVHVLPIALFSVAVPGGCVIVGPDLESASASDSTATDAASTSTTDSPTTSTTGPGVEPAHDCVQYTPDAVEGAHDGAWATIEDVVVLPIDIADPGGGLVEVTLTIGDTPTSIDVLRRGAPDEEIHVGVLAGAEAERTEAFVFRAQGDHEYDLVVKPFVSPTDEGDDSFHVEWRYTPLVDCYEHNQSVAAARRIPLDTPITAHAHPGIIAGDGALVGPGVLDFYAVELAEPTRVRLAVTKPDDTPLVFEFWDPAIEYGIVGVDSLGAGGVELHSDELELAPGTHIVRVAHFDAQPSTWNLRDPLPAGWTGPYTLTVQRR